jgi:hypothetical protein
MIGRKGPWLLDPNANENLARPDVKTLKAPDQPKT